MAVAPKHSRPKRPTRTSACLLTRALPTAVGSAALTLLCVERYPVGNIRCTKNPWLAREPNGPTCSPCQGDRQVERHRQLLVTIEHTCPCSCRGEVARSRCLVCQRASSRRLVL